MDSGSSAGMTYMHTFSKTKNILIFLFFLLLPIFFFHPYFFEGKVPFPGNLLVSFYSPWRSEPFPGFKGGIPNKPIGFDNVRIFFPNIKLTVDEWRNGRLPTWNPYIFSGNAHIGMFQTAIFYPLSFLYLILPLIDAWSLLVIIQPVLAGYFTFLFLRTIKISRTASLFGGIVFAYSGWMISWWEESIVIEHTVLWLPLALLSVTKLWEHPPKYRYVLSLLLALIFSFLAGFFQTTLYVFALVLFWHFFLWCTGKHTKDSEHTGWTITVIIFLTIGMVAIQWLPTIESFLTSPRTNVDMRYLFETYLMPWQHLLTFIAPDFYGNPGTYNYMFPKAFFHEKVIFFGVIPFILSLTAFFTRRDTTKLFWMVVAVITVSLGFQLPTSWLPYLLHIPILESSQPARIFSIATFALAIMSAYGFADLFENKGKRNIPIKLILFVITILMIFLLLMLLGIYMIDTHCVPGTLSMWCTDRIVNPMHALYTILYMNQPYKFIAIYTMVSMRNFVIPFLLIGILWVCVIGRNRFHRTAIGLCFAGIFFSSLYFAQKYLYFSERQFTFPETELVMNLKRLSGINRVWGYGNAYVEKNFLSYFGLSSPEGYAPFFSTDYAKLLQAVRIDGKWSDVAARADVDVSPVSEKETIMSNPRRMRLLDILGVTNIFEAKTGEDKKKLLTETRFPPDTFSLVWENDRWRIWRSHSAVPRISFVHTYEVIRDPQQTLDRLFDATFDPTSEVILDEDPHENRMDGASEISTHVSVNHFTPSSIEVDVAASRSGILLVSDTYDTGWIAAVDGKKTKILKADTAFRAIPVESGNHTISFRYDPWSIRWGAIITLSTIVITAVYFIIFIRRHQ